MNIAIYTLTRDRLAYTQHCFELLQQRAGVPYDHYIIDNGSQDGTVEWLNSTQKQFKHIRYSKGNLGISRASNIALEIIFNSGITYDLIVKMDNDCEILSENILGQMVEIYEDTGKFAPKFVLSPFVEGIVNQPTRGRYTQLAGRRIGLTAIVGGLFHVVPAVVYAQYRYPESLPLASGQDDNFCSWIKAGRGEVGYVEGLIVNHYETTEGQARRFPDYFKRKWEEEK